MTKEQEERLNDTRYRGDRTGCALDLADKLIAECRGKKIEECATKLVEVLSNAYSHGSHEMEVLLCDM